MEQPVYTTVEVFPLLGGRVTGTWDAIRYHLDHACFDWVYDTFKAELRANTPLSWVMHRYVASRTLDAFANEADGA